MNPRLQLKTRIHDHHLDEGVHLESGALDRSAILTLIDWRWALKYVESFGWPRLARSSRVAGQPPYSGRSQGRGRERLGHDTGDRSSFYKGYFFKYKISIISPR